MKWKATVFCPDCTGVDRQGCFDGGSETQEFETECEAVEWVTAYTRDSIWDYEIEECK